MAAITSPPRLLMLMPPAMPAATEVPPLVPVAKLAAMAAPAASPMIRALAVRSALTEVKPATVTRPVPFVGPWGRLRSS